MRFLLTLTMTCVLFGVSYAQKDSTVHAIGKDKDGDMWYVDTSLTRRLSPPSDWAILMPIYTLLPGRALVFYFNVDCSDLTYQFYKAQSIDRDGNILFEKIEKSAWVKWTGYSGNGARIVCASEGKKSTKLPVINSKEVDGR